MKVRLMPELRFKDRIQEIQGLKPLVNLCLVIYSTNFRLLEASNSESDLKD